jgi:sugar/nucleoside kinase (ribokinase family)
MTKQYEEYELRRDETTDEGGIKTSYFGGTVPNKGPEAEERWTTQFGSLLVTKAEAEILMLKLLENGAKLVTKAGAQNWVMKLLEKGSIISCRGIYN